MQHREEEVGAALPCRGHHACRDQSMGLQSQLLQRLLAEGPCDCPAPPQRTSCSTTADVLNQQLKQTACQEQAATFEGNGTESTRQYQLSLQQIDVLDTACLSDSNFSPETIVEEATIPIAFV